MNLVNDLDTEIAFAVLVEKKHCEKIKSKDVIPLLKRLNEIFESISETEKSADSLTEKRILKSAFH